MRFRWRTMATPYINALSCRVRCKRRRLLEFKEHQSPLAYRNKTEWRTLLIGVNLFTDLVLYTPSRVEILRKIVATRKQIKLVWFCILCSFSSYYFVEAFHSVIFAFTTKANWLLPHKHISALRGQVTTQLVHNEYQSIFRYRTWRDGVLSRSRSTSCSCCV